ncbi:MAG: tetratricopeptide repeat protein [Bacteroidota bacterium]|nr:tetratricopeptide repeat protein [Bacteroidota bacterium]
MVRAWLLLAVLFTSHGAAVAQRQDVRVTQPPRQNMDSSTAARFQLATEYLRGGQFDRAIPLLENLYENQPGSVVFFDKLKEAYENVKRYPAAIKLIDGQLEQGNQDQTALLVEQARLYYLAGQDRTAAAQWDAVLTASNGSESVYRLVYNSLLRLRLLDRAIEVLLRGRASHTQSILFQPELAYLYGLTGQHERAMEEYLGLLETSSRQINYVRGRLSRSLDQDGALEAALEVTGRSVAAHPDRAVIRDLLSWLHMEAGSFDAAYEHVVIMDRLNGGDGQAIYSFAQRAAEAGAFEVARRAYESVQFIHNDALLGIGHMLELQGESAVEGTAYFAAALNTYSALLAEHPEHPQRADVMMRMARLRQYTFHDSDAAATMLKTVANEFAYQPVSQQAWLALGRLELERDQLDEAERIFAGLAGATPVTEFTTQAQLEVALMHFYHGDFARAEQSLGLLSEATSDDVANNALSLRLLLLENPVQDSAAAALGAYAEARLLLRQQKEDAVIRRTDEMLSRWAHHPIADDARFLRARAFRQSHRIDEALAAFGELPLLHPNSPHSDNSLFMYAEILEQNINDPSAAADAYADLLTRFPGSLLVNEARERIRRLRIEGV